MASGSRLAELSQLEFDFATGTIRSSVGTPVGTTNLERSPGRWRRHRVYRDIDGLEVLRTFTNGMPSTVWSPHHCMNAAGEVIGAVRWKDVRAGGVVLARNRHPGGGATTACSPRGNELASVRPVPRSPWRECTTWRLEIQPEVELSFRLLILGLPHVCYIYASSGD
jgi:hypothetical protein